MVMLSSACVFHSVNASLDDLNPESTWPVVLGSRVGGDHIETIDIDMAA